MNKDTPRTNALTARMAGELGRPMLVANHFIELCDHARTLERDLTACRAALREYVAIEDEADRMYEDATWEPDDLDDIDARRATNLAAARAILQSTGEGEGK